MVSIMNVEKVYVGPCQVNLDGRAAGLTSGGVTLEIEFNTQERDLLGYPLNYDIKLENIAVSCRVPLAEFTIRNLEIAMPFASSSGTTLNLNKTSGYLRQYAIPLTLKPINVERNETITMPKAVPIAMNPIKYDKDKQRIINIKFQALTKSKEDRLVLSITPH